ncbi:hypothetical protein DNU24_09105 [Salmonella enterica subsp. salamae]|uniref:DUF4329 domain-containing protein n=1 Tax=Salmonella enterica subsp. salamae TaxID=59202 RepID=A0A5Y3X5U1_SALER|nr:hypothetical protein [Salmonella enterica subsp. salamae]
MLLLIRLPVQRYDEESGLHYNRHRYYDPGQGQFGRDLKKCMELKRVYLQNSSCPLGSTKVGDYHTHGFYSDIKGNLVSPQNDSYDSLHFSPQDISGIATDGIGNPYYTGYLGTPNNKYYKFTPGTGKIEEMK